MADPERHLVTRRQMLKFLAAAGALATVKLLWPVSSPTDENIPDEGANSNPVGITGLSVEPAKHEPLFKGAIATGRIAVTDRQIPLNIYPDNYTTPVGPFNTEQDPWPIYPGGRIVTRSGENQLLVPISKPDGKGKYTEIDIRYFKSVDGDPIGAVPVHNNSWIGIGGNWPPEAFSTVENLGVGFIRVNRSNPIYREILAKAKTRGMKTVLTYDINFAERMSASNGTEQVRTMMLRELEIIAQNYQPALVQVSNEPDFNQISPEMYAQIFSFATEAFSNTSNAPKLVAASIRPAYLESYLTELLRRNIIPWAHDIHAYQQPKDIGDVYNQTIAVLNKYPQFHREHLIVLEWGITDKKVQGNKNQIIDGLDAALSLNIPIALHQLFNADGEGYGIYNPSGNGAMKATVDAFLFKQYVKQTPRTPQPDDWI